MKVLIYQRHRIIFMKLCTSGILPLFFLLLIPVQVQSQFMFQFKKDTIVKWHYFDGDEFNDTLPDTLKWIPALSYTDMNYDVKALMLKKRLVLENGVCKFMAHRDTGIYTVPGWQLHKDFEKQNKIQLINTNQVQYQYTLGTVWSRQQYGKGYFEIRFKSTSSLGMWPAFWLFGNNNKDEIDFFELKGEKENAIHLDVHCPEGCENYKGNNFFRRRFGGWISTTEKLTNGFNVLAGEWQDGYVKWYLNGLGIGYFKGDFASQTMSLICGMGMTFDGLAFAPGVNESTVFPNHFDVDYIRIWKKEKVDPVKVAGKQHRLFNYSEGKDGMAQARKKISYMYNKKIFREELFTISILPAKNRKLIISLLGSNKNVKICLSDTSGAILLQQNIQQQFTTIDVPGAASLVKINISSDMQQTEEWLELAK